MTWTTDVAPIMEKRCLGCHTAGGFAPISLATYEDAKRWAKAISEEVQARRMPPWPAARGFGDFINDRSLTRNEVELLTAWADGGTPLGPMPLVRDRPTRIEIPRLPDLVLEVPAVRIQRPTEHLELGIDLKKEQWIAGWEFRPGTASLVEHATLKILPDTVIGTWVPPETVVRYPSGVARRLPAGSRLGLDVRYLRPTGSAIVRSTVGLYFNGRPRYQLEQHSFPCGSTRVDQDLKAVAVRPHTSEAGASVEVVARRPDSTVEPLTVVPSYQPRYPVTYRFRKAIPVPAGTVVDIRSSAEHCGADIELVERQSRSRTGKVNGAVITSPPR